MYPDKIHYPEDVDKHSIPKTPTHVVTGKHPVYYIQTTDGRVYSLDGWNWRVGNKVDKLPADAVRC